MYFLIVSLLLVIRAVVFVYFFYIEGQYIAPDSQEYISIATNLLEHQTFSSSLLPPLEPNFLEQLDTLSF